MTSELRVEDKVVSHQVKKMKLKENSENEKEYNKAHNIQVHESQKCELKLIV